MKSMLTSLMLLASGATMAELPPIDPPPPPPQSVPAEQLPPVTKPKANKAVGEPEVRIIEKADATIAEYRMNGRLYMMKVTPKVGAPYVLYDHEGNGQFDRIDGADSGGARLSVPQWTLFSW
ncbi:DUF2782 domain-containing protein [Jeongeupia sp. USM3]|uniref:DUF2782 domain-containing protein n=1 Tax=Jeongeupia sp. USM3 TaxID=1906741 RepID=UPI00089DD7FD|nr:DUF2782 domain-containing protein [Jeongeupia sp. USM3]AOY00851.1 hypothetical protein BJP62_10630 [Jeongeupia sp. USM3]